MYYKTTGYKTTGHFPEDQELKRKWIYFVNRKDWSPTAHSVTCIGHFEEKLIKGGKKCKLLQFIMIQNPVRHS